MRIGILTHYYNSINYGGTLQAFALCKFLNNCGYEAEQVCYSKRRQIKMYNAEVWLDTINTASSDERLMKKIYRFLFKILKRTIKQILAIREVHEPEWKKELYNNSFATFAKNYVPHSQEIYNYYTISDCIDKYDFFISGSDQVWNDYDYVWSLDFVRKRRKKMSYAASIAKDSLNEEMKNAFSRILVDYDSISVREKSDKKLLEELTKKDIEVVVDPVFLLEEDNWLELVKEKKEKKYVFGYFLGTNKKERELAKQMSQQLGAELFILSMNYNDVNNPSDEFSPYYLHNISPEEFLSYIYGAEVVFTDSFHAAAFSIILKKEFFVFNRDARRRMTSRIYTLTQMTGTEQRFCDSEEKENIEYLRLQEAIDYKSVQKKLNDEVVRSREYLLGTLKEIANE